MTTRADLRAELRHRLYDPLDQFGDDAACAFLDDELDAYLDAAITSLYPHWYVFGTGTTTAGPGPEQDLPAGAVNIYYVGVKKDTSTRVRTIRGWHEGATVAIVPKVNIEGDELVWAWTTPHDAPASDVAVLTIPLQAEEVVVLRSQISALERVITDRVKAARYFATQVREGITENDIAVALDALHQSVDVRMKDAPGPPDRVG